MCSPRDPIRSNIQRSLPEGLLHQQIRGSAEHGVGRCWHILAGGVPAKGRRKWGWPAQGRIDREQRRLLQLIEPLDNAIGGSATAVAYDHVANPREVGAPLSESQAYLGVLCGRVNPDDPH